MGRTIIFLYGSLKRGHCNHHLVAGQQYLGDAATVPGYCIIEIGQYGGMIRDEKCGTCVKGELWAVDEKCLLELDEFESGEGSWQRVDVAIPDRTNVQSYCWTGPVPDGVRASDAWPFPGTGKTYA